MSSSTDQKTTEIEKASAEPSVDTSDATVADNTANAETAAAPTPAGDSNETTAKPAEDKEAAPVKPASKLSATAKDFTFNAKVAEFKPKWMDGGAAAAAPAGPMGQPPKGGAVSSNIVLLSVAYLLAIRRNMIHMRTRPNLHFLTILPYITLIFIYIGI
jgi:hypothetical protein